MDTTTERLQAKRTEILEQMGLLEEKPTDHGSISFGKRVGEGTAMAVDRLSQVAVHDKVMLLGAKQRRTTAEHRPPRGQAAAVVRVPEEQELATAGAPIAEYALAVKKRSVRWPDAMRRLSQMRREYPAEPFVAAVQSALHYGLYDLDRLERMVLRNVATHYFVLPEGDDDIDKEEPDEG